MSGLGGGEGVYQLPFIVIMCAGVSGSTLDEMYNSVTLKLCTAFTAIILCLFKYWRAFQELVHFRYWDGDG